MVRFAARTSIKKYSEHDELIIRNAVEPKLVVESTMRQILFSLILLSVTSRTRLPRSHLIEQQSVKNPHRFN